MAPLYTGAFDCCRKTFLNEGLRGFYKGYTTNNLLKLLENSL